MYGLRARFLLHFAFAKIAVDEADLFQEFFGNALAAFQERCESGKYLPREQQHTFILEYPRRDDRVGTQGEIRIAEFHETDVVLAREIGGKTGDGSRLTVLQKIHDRLFLYKAETALIKRVFDHHAASLQRMQRRPHPGEIMLALQKEQIPGEGYLLRPGHGGGLDFRRGNEDRPLAVYRVAALEFLCVKYAAREKDVHRYPMRILPLQVLAFCDMGFPVFSLRHIETLNIAVEAETACVCHFDLGIYLHRIDISIGKAPIVIDR